MNRSFLFILFFFIGVVPAARADQEVFTPYKEVSSDGRYVFVMLNDVGGVSVGIRNQQSDIRIPNYKHCLLGF
jgi:hypothetical protein